MRMRMMMVQMMMKLTLSKFPPSLRTESLSPLVSLSSLVSKEDEDEEEDEEEGFLSLPQFHPRISMLHTPPSCHICHLCLCVFVCLQPVCFLCCLVWSVITTNSNPNPKNSPVGCKCRRFFVCHSYF